MGDAKHTSRKCGLILLAHGARDPLWAEPFERLLARVRARKPDTEARLAYLELMHPDLAGAIDELIAACCTDIKIVPAFFGQGSHVRQDLPVLIKRLQIRYSHVAIRCTIAVGEDDAVLDAVAAFCVRG